MNMKQNTLLGWLVAGFICIGLVHAEMPKEDTVKNAKDHPLLSRFAGSKLVGYGTKEFDEVSLPAGKQILNKESKRAFEKTQDIEVKLTRIAYNFAPERSALEVMRNYQAAIQKAGLKTVFSCDKDACGKNFGELMLDRIGKDFKFEGSSDYQSPFNYGREEPRYLLAAGTRSDGSPVYASLYVVQPVQTKNGGVYLEIVEPKPMETEKVSASLNAGDMAKSIAAEGKIALYGIYFDTAKADIKPESKAQLDEMAKLLQQDAKLRVFVVGHTDNQGSVAANVDLSQKRAEAVAKVLASQYKIEAKRMTAKGIANLSPVASSKDEAGRAKNRRVELVEQ